VTALALSTAHCILRLMREIEQSRSSTAVPLATSAAGVQPLLMQAIMRPHDESESDAVRVDLPANELKWKQLLQRLIREQDLKRA
jgi:hypothetical protein